MNELQTITDEQVKIIHRARERVIETIGKNMDLYGVTLSVGHLYGTMFFQDKPMTLDEMGEALGMSKTSMSTGVRTLMDLKMVKKVWQKGARKDHYEVEPDWFQTFTDFFVVKWRQSMEMNANSLKKSIAELEALKEKYPGEERLQQIVRNDLAKLNGALEYYEWLSRLIDSFESGEIYKLVPKE